MVFPKHRHTVQDTLLYKHAVKSDTLMHPLRMPILMDCTIWLALMKTTKFAEHQ